MSKTCARCGKTVYPIEELKCLDKTWHKQCFKCQVCQMTLNMRNYKGFNKEPYCEAHIPKAKATTVAETPEYRRIAENTKIQSNVKYHADFEKAKGKFTQVADDPETLRIKENSKNISNVAYHGELQKKADMERQRNIGDKGEVGPMRPSEVNNGGYQQSRNVPASNQVPLPNEPPGVHHSRMPSNVIYTSDRGAVTSSPDRRVGSIHDLDPVNDYYGSLSSDANPHGHGHNYPQQQLQHQQQQQQRYYAPQQETSQAKYPGGYGEQMGRRDASGYGINNGRGGAQTRAPTGYQKEYSDQGYNEPPPSSVQQPRNSGRVFRAMYEYKAADADEVSFLEGDFIVNCTPIDEGWLSGVVQRTGKKGMLPANYVSPAI